jgi:hypothetical protein
MKTYLARAEEARKSALTARNPEERKAFEEIANLWVRLAERERTKRELRYS